VIAKETSGESFADRDDVWVAYTTPGLDRAERSVVHDLEACDNASRRRLLVLHLYRTLMRRGQSANVPSTLLST
jgi:hypothetical protein